MIEDVTERRGQQTALEHQALHDSLTGLPNRVLLRDRLQQAILTGKREGQGVAILLMDLDQFKQVNDTLGHHHGDLLLKLVGMRLATVLRSSDTIARLGGDEFAVVLPGVQDQAAVAHCARKILQAVDLGSAERRPV
jgi:diguanylate cyclase (GGDEF)-like protein